MLKNPNAAQIVTLGCRLNIWESEVMRHHAHAADLTDMVVINSCAVTADAEKQTRQAIRQARRERPHAKVVVTGCAAQINPKTWQNMDEVDIIVGNHDKLKAETWQKLSGDNPPKEQITDIMDVKEVAGHLLQGFDQHTRGFLQVQQGCNHRCTFCTIPFGRGPARSLTIPDAIKSVQAMVDKGLKEVVLTGVDMTSWGEDLPGEPRLGMLVKAILQNVPDLPRLRLSSIDPAELDMHLMEALDTQARLMPHLHLSVQHGDNLILKRMKRRHLNRDVVRFCEEARRRRPETVFGADIITGFPTEDTFAHKQTQQLIEEANLTYLHIFSFSPRPGTPAAKMPQLEKSIVKQRSSELRQIAKARLADHLDKRVGTTDMLLVEKNGKGHLSSFEHASIIGPSFTYKRGRLVPVKIISAQQGIAFATPLKTPRS